MSQLIFTSKSKMALFRYWGMSSSWGRQDFSSRSSERYIYKTKILFGQSCVKGGYKFVLNFVLNNCWAAKLSHPEKRNKCFIHGLLRC